MQPLSLHATQITPRPDGAARQGTDEGIDWRAVAAALVHPLKLAILEELARSEEPASAVGLTRAFAKRKKNPWYLALVSYHLKALADAGLVVPRKKRQVRGATETFYVLARKK